jgi:glycogen debranching enzyme
MNRTFPRDDILLKSKATIAANIVSTSEGEMLAAGGAHFRSLWVRDFCISVPGLLKCGYAELVARQLLSFYNYRSERGQIPRGLDVVSPKLRVTWNLFLPRNPSFMSYEGKGLRPEMLGEHKTPSYDSNVLFVLAALDYQAATKVPLFSSRQLEELLSYYSPSSDGLFVQPAFSDWQDSARREGRILFTHLLYLKAAMGLNLEKDVERIRRLIREHFFDGTFFRESPSRNQISLDSHLFILTNQIAIDGVDRRTLYANLKSHPIWSLGAIPGVPVFPAYSRKEISWTQKMIGLEAYHSGFVWGWLAAEAVKCAAQYGDEAEADRILTFFEAKTRAEEYLSEIYSSEPVDFSRYKSLIYKSESPFSWTAAKWIEALA